MAKLKYTTERYLMPSAPALTVKKFATSKYSPYVGDLNNTINESTGKASTEIILGYLSKDKGEAKIFKKVGKTLHDPDREKAHKNIAVKARYI